MAKKRRRILWWILIPILVLVLGVAGVVVATVIHLNRATHGSVIDSGNLRSALLVVDVQKDTVDNPGYSGTSEFVEQVNQAIAIAQDKGMEVIYIKNEYNGWIMRILSGGRYMENTPGVELDDSLDLVSSKIFTKSIGDSFSAVGLHEYLITQGVGTVYLVGADAAACVHSTAQGALNRGYRVEAIEDALLTANDATLDRMLNQYKTEGVFVITLDEFKQE